MTRLLYHKASNLLARDASACESIMRSMLYHKASNLLARIVSYYGIKEPPALSASGLIIYVVIKAYQDFSRASVLVVRSQTSAGP